MVTLRRAPRHRAEPDPYGWAAYRTRLIVHACAACVLSTVRYDTVRSTAYSQPNPHTRQTENL